MNVKLKKGCWLLFVLSLLFQILLVFWSDGTQIDDMTRYEYYALRIADGGGFYPNIHDLYVSYIHSPGYINFLGLLLIIFKSIKAALYFNVLLNAILALEIFYIGIKYFNDVVGYLSLFLFIIYPTTYGIVSFAGSDLPYIVLTFGVIILYARGNVKMAILAGIIAATANWIRPFIPILIFVVLFITFFLINKEQRLKNILAFTLSTVIVVLIIGGITWNRFGYFVFQSTTSGVNMIMGANDIADGSYEDAVFSEGNTGFISDNDSLTFAEKDAYWRERSVSWIKENPGKWISLFPKKIFFMYVHDSHAMSPLSGDISLPVQGREYNIDMVKSFPSWNAFQWLMCFNQVFYSICLVLSCIGIFYVIRRKNMMGCSLLLFWILSTGVILMTVGTNRYHYPLIPIIFLFASYALTNMNFLKKNNKINNI